MPLKKPIEIVTQYGENDSDSTKQKDIAFQYFSGPLFGNALTKRPERYDSNGSKVKNYTSDSNGVKKDSEKFLIDSELGDSNGEIEIDSSDSVIDQPRTQTVKIAPILEQKSKICDLDRVLAPCGQVLGAPESKFGGGPSFGGSKHLSDSNVNKDIEKIETSGFDPKLLELTQDDLISREDDSFQYKLGFV